MKKNVSGQKIGCQMVSATDGSAFTGAVTVYVTGDAGTQSAGSVGSGACTHEGNGFHTYAPAQAETNYDHIAFTFIGTGAVPVTVQLYTAFPQTGDAFDRLGAPAGASIAADIATVDTVVDAIKAKTDNLPTDPADASDIASSFTTVNSKLDAIDDYIDTEVSAIKAKTDNLPASPAATGDIPSAASIADAVLDEALSGHVTAGSLGKAVADIEVDTSTTLQGELDGIQADTEDIQSKIGTPAGASVSADIAAVKSQTNAIETDTQDIQTKIGSPAGASVSADIAAVKSETAAILVDTGTTLDGKIDTIDTNVDSILDDTGTSGVKIAAAQLSVKKNTALSNFEFVMTDSTTHAPKTGVAVTAQRSIDGAAFAACANAVSELSNGVYKINLAAADLNGDVITLRFTGTASDDLLITILTQA